MLNLHSIASRICQVLRDIVREINMELPAITPASPQGMPIYSDTHVRGIVDSLEKSSKSTDWHPANAMALKLWQCLEALRDIDVALENVSQQKNATKKKRQLKQFSVQLHSLGTCVVRLCDQIVGDSDARRWLKEGSTAQVSKIKTEFLDLTPISHGGDLSIFRNQLGGHIDAKLSPWSAEKILRREAISNFGKWLHICIHTVLGLMKLDIYSWSVRAEKVGQIRLMTNEPFLLTLEVDDEIRRVVALHISKQSPRQAIVEVIENVLKESQWMFKQGQPRIGSTVVDESDAWNTFSGSRSAWKTEAMEAANEV